MFRTLSLVTILAAAGCASGTTQAGAPEAPEAPEAVPVYTKAEVRCEYEVLRPLSVELRLMSTSEFGRVMRRELGREGARIGADAVIVSDREVPVAVPRGRPIPPVTVEGQAVRFVEEGCG